MIRELLTPEAHPDAYVWAAVLLAHAGIGVALWLLLSIWCARPWRAALMAAGVYLGFEAAQAAASGHLLIWDSLLDWSAVSLGAVLAAGLWQARLRAARVAVVAVAIIAAVGAWVRRPR